MPRSGIKRKSGRRKEFTDTPELLEVCRQLAQLALAREDRPAGPRQREELRRALAIAGEGLGWSETPENAAEDVMAMAVAGAAALERDLADEWERKQTEVERLGDVAAHARKLSEDAGTVYPVEITYSHTVRDPHGNLVTRVTTNTATNAAEALAAAEALRRSLEGRTKLTDQMIIDLEQRRERLNGIASCLPDFVDSSRDLISEVIANLT
jgi:hypothetical protein